MRSRAGLLLRISDQQEIAWNAQRQELSELALRIYADAKHRKEGVDGMSQFVPGWELVVQYARWWQSIDQAAELEFFCDGIGVDPLPPAPMLPTRWRIQGGSLMKRTTTASREIESMLATEQISALVAFDFLRLFRNAGSAAWHVERWLDRGLERLAVVTTEIPLLGIVHPSTRVLDRAELKARCRWWRALNPESRGGRRDGAGRRPLLSSRREIQESRG